MSDMFSPISLGDLNLKNRIFMAPLTRTRAGRSHVPNALMAEYYAQRADSGLIIAEATMVMPGQSAFMGEPGIYSAEQVAHWQVVTDAVHTEGGRIFLQIWHGGRACHPALNDGATPVAPSAVGIQGDEVHTPEGKKPYVLPRALDVTEIGQVVEGFRTAAENAKKAGFDGVELHGANGYLIDQFLRSSTNLRTDEYGGSRAKRARFLFECLDAVVDVWGSQRVALRLSLLNSYNDIADEDPIGLAGYLAKELNRYPLAFLHAMRGDFAGVQKGDILTPMRQAYQGTLVGNMGYSKEEANAAIVSGVLDAVTFGSAFIANPDLVERFVQNAPLNTPNPKTFYTPGAAGYTDYPALPVTV